MAAVLPRSATVALLIASLSAVVPAAANAGWSRPSTLAPPVSLDIQAPQVAFSPAGVSGVGFTVQDEDAPADSSSYVAWRSASGTISAPRTIPGQLELLGIAFGGRTAQLLTGDSPQGQSCCTSASLESMSASGRFGRARVLVRDLSGVTAGQLVPLGRRMLAAIGNERGIWISQSDRNGRWGATRRLSELDARPEALQAVQLSNGGAAIAWIGGSSSVAGRRSIFVATGTPTKPPRRGHALLNVARGHAIDELALARGAGEPTLAWLESWFDRRGNYHSEVVTASLSHPKRTTRFAIAGTTASALVLAGDSRGNQILGWMSCTWNATCIARAATREGAKQFTRPQRLGPIDATEAPAVSVSRAGAGVIGWIDRGRVLARELRPRETRFAGTHVVSNTSYAANLAIAFGPPNVAMAAWSQGTLAPDVVGALFRP